MFAPEDDEEGDSLMHGDAIDGIAVGNGLGAAALPNAIGARAAAGPTAATPHQRRQTPPPPRGYRGCLRRLNCATWTSGQRHRALSALYLAGLAAIGIVYATAGEAWATIVMAVVFITAIVVQTTLLVVRFCGSQQLREMRAALRERALEAAVERAALGAGLGDGRAGGRRGRGGAGMRVVRVPLEHLHLMLRELSAEDYDALLALDGGPDDPSAALQAAGEDEIRRLPTYAYRKRGSGGATATSIAVAAAAAASADAAASGSGTPRSSAAADSASSGSAAAAAASSAKIASAVAAASTSDAPAAASSSSSSDSAATTCSICLESFEDGESLRMLPCMHAYHTPCIDTWLQQKASCPVCKISIRDPVFESV